MEILRLAGYSEEEKVQIARRYLIPRQLKEAGLNEDQVQFSEDALQTVISRYTREAGVRQLERSIGQLARKVAVRYAENRGAPAAITGAEVLDLLGPERFFMEQAREDLPAGVATGLAWTESGGEVLYIEAVELPGGRDLTLTGQLGEVMRESAALPRATFGRRQRSSACRPNRSARRGSTFTFRRALFPKTARRQAWRWPRP